MKAPARINIVFPDNGAGLSRDATVLHLTLRRMGHQVTLTRLAPLAFPRTLRYAPEHLREALRRATRRSRALWRPSSRPWDFNLHLERVDRDHLGTARTNCLIPNQEWIQDEDRPLLGDVDLVLFKTRRAMALLGAHVARGAYLGFASLDRRDVGTRPRWDRALHVAGWNPYKGTATLLSAWEDQTGWPALTVVSQLAVGAAAGNVQIVRSRVGDSALRRMQNDAAVHVCPSEVEGFGHTLAEALSCGALVVTTDAAPMNELVTPDAGVLVRAKPAEPLGADVRHLVSVDDLRDAISRVVGMSGAERQRRSAAARARFDDLTSGFRQRLEETLNLT